jgi:hypothetical protein
MKSTFLFAIMFLLLGQFAGAQVKLIRSVSGSVPYGAVNIQLRYNSDLSSTYSTRSLVDKHYADSIGNPSKKYIVLISQATTADPAATALQNTLGDIVWARTGTGVYTGTLTGAFVSGKTFFHVQNNLNDSTKFVLKRTSANVVTLSTYSGTALADGLLSSSPMKIEVY